MKAIKFLIITLLTTPLIFTACNKDDEPPTAIESFGEGFPLNYKIKHPQNHTIDIITAEIDGIGNKAGKIAETKYNNGEGTIVLPSVIKAEYLRDITSFLPKEITSDRTVQYARINFGAYYENKNFACFILSAVRYIYVNKPVQIKGQIKEGILTSTYDLSFSPGWNGYNTTSNVDGNGYFTRYHTSEITNSGWGLACEKLDSIN